MVRDKTQMEKGLFALPLCPKNPVYPGALLPNRTTVFLNVVYCFIASSNGPSDSFFNTER